MGLLGFFLSKRFLKLFFILIGIFLFLQLFLFFISLVSGLGWSFQIVLIAFTLSAFGILTSSSDPAGFSSGLVRFLCLTVIPLILVFNAVMPLAIPYPLSIPLKLGALSLPFLIYFAYRDKSPIKNKTKALHSTLRRHGRISKESLLPKGIEEGHILYNAGLKGFKGLKFVEVKWKQLDSLDKHTQIDSIRKKISENLTKQLTLMRKLRMEVSYEFYWQSGRLQVIIAPMCEGRNYRRCRADLDDTTRAIVMIMNSTNQQTDMFVKPIEDNNGAKKALMMPLFTTVEDLKQVENDKHNLKIFHCGRPEKSARLRSIHLTGLESLDESNPVGLFDELLGAVLVHGHRQGCACILHVRPLDDEILVKDLARIGEAYQCALTRFTERLKSGLAGGGVNVKTLISKRGASIEDARRSAEEAKITLRHLKEAEKSGYFEVSLTIIGEPPVAESISFALKEKLSLHNTYMQLFLVRGAPREMQEMVRRDLVQPLGRLSGNEITFLMTS